MENSLYQSYDLKCWMQACHNLMFDNTSSEFLKENVMPCNAIVMLNYMPFWNVMHYITLHVMLNLKHYKLHALLVIM